LISVLGLASLALFTVLYVSDSPAYYRILTVIMQVPEQRPFVDWEYIYKAISCSKMGVNVFYSNPCYTVIETPPFAYSPFWLYATFIPDGLFWGNIVGISLAALFFISLALLPPPRNWLHLAVTLLATQSSAVALGVERANADLLMFLVILAGARLGVLRLPFRMLGYGLFILAGLLKFYPMVALLTALRERFLVFIAVFAAASASLALLIVTHHDDMVLMYRHLPAPSYFELQFGAANLPAGIGHIVYVVLTKLLHSDPVAAHTVDNLIHRSLSPALTVVAVATAIRTSAQWRLQDAISRIASRDAGFFIVGAIIICGCFFVGQNHTYRAIYLLLALPGLLALSLDLPYARGRSAFRFTTFAIVYVQWSLFIEWLISAVGLGNMPGNDATFGYVQWLCNELAWWWIVTILLSVVFTFVMSTNQWRLLSRILRLPAAWYADRAPIAAPTSG
jgi:hypothetical protein